MNRREFLRYSAIGSVSALIGCSNLTDRASPQKENGPGSPSTSNRRNILYIMTDQHHFQALGCAGNSIVRTPNLDALAADGILFENAYCASPICGPSRACDFTGCYPWQTGVWDNHKPFQQPLPILSERLAESGFQTALIGKLHLWPMDHRWGFNYRQRNDAMYNTYAPEADHSDYITWAAETLGSSRDRLIRYFEADEESDNRYRFYMGSNEIPEDAHYNTWVQRMAVDYLDNTWNRNHPFFLFVGIFGPHQPMLAPNRWSRMYDPDRISLPPQFHAKVHDKPAFYQNRKRDQFFRQGWTEHTWKQVLAAYYGQVSQIDHNIGLLIAKLRDMGIYDNTTIVFTADHGDMNGQFALLEKGNMYEGAAHVPLIVRDPHAKNNRRASEVVNTIDLYRTLLENEGIACAKDTPSRNLSPILHRQGKWENRTFSSVYYQSMIRRDQFKLIRRNRMPDHSIPYELYDLSDKPYEMRNLFHDSKFDTIAFELKAELEDCFAIPSLMESGE